MTDHNEHVDHRNALQQVCRSHKRFVWIIPWENPEGFAFRTKQNCNAECVQKADGWTRLEGGCYCIWCPKSDGLAVCPTPHFFNASHQLWNVSLICSPQVPLSCFILFHLKGITKWEQLRMTVLQRNISCCLFKWKKKIELHVCMFVVYEIKKIVEVIPVAQSWTENSSAIAKVWHCHWYLWAFLQAAHGFTARCFDMFNNATVSVWTFYFHPSLASNLRFPVVICITMSLLFSMCCDTVLQMPLWFSSPRLRTLLHNQSTNQWMDCLLMMMMLLLCCRILTFVRDCEGSDTQLWSWHEANLTNSFSNSIWHEGKGRHSWPPRENREKWIKHWISIMKWRIKEWLLTTYERMEWNE